MVMLKISAFFIAYALIICQMYCSNAAPSRPALEPSPDEAMLSDYEARRLLNAFIKEFVQMAAEDLEQQETEENSESVKLKGFNMRANAFIVIRYWMQSFLRQSMGRPMSKRCSNLSTCVLGKLSQELHKLQTYPRTNVGAGTPGKKRSAEHVYREPADLI
ncbi:calcitonin/calcitonin-related polypeptide, alpha isoform X4 [Silurus meridionalis]|uniref:calcitonin/calcitonin-related polypeptide, alpha isoform X4 n=1 Tax=Silurus meridionalis TaxID=175797 RepID=UPI001EEAAC06|nr:calcitonin/calcitonin-related polypeptide, alpha isoform X4 [Silurus meridionalis]XP_046714431.1 calcitonin/calcitonin-related polypeptide, alpha isoform X4 [Silurus meridionalis]XP_046714433.1 calcitonin/calcitonin-related polypeptide, alpha isoform X4 [Silurus meridionalis]